MAYPKWPIQKDEANLMPMAVTLRSMDEVYEWRNLRAPVVDWYSHSPQKGVRAKLQEVTRGLYTPHYGPDVTEGTEGACLIRAFLAAREALAPLECYPDTEHVLDYYTHLAENGLAFDPKEALSHEQQVAFLRSVKVGLVEIVRKSYRRWSYQYYVPDITIDENQPRYYLLVRMVTADVGPSHVEPLVTYDGRTSLLTWKEMASLLQLTVGITLGTEPAPGKCGPAKDLSYVGSPKTYAGELGDADDEFDNAGVPLGDARRAETPNLRQQFPHAPATFPAVRPMPHISPFRSWMNEPDALLANLESVHNEMRGLLSHERPGVSSRVAVQDASGYSPLSNADVREVNERMRALPTPIRASIAGNRSEMHLPPTEISLAAAAALATANAAAARSGSSPSKEPPHEPQAAPTAADVAEAPATAKEEAPEIRPPPPPAESVDFVADRYRRDE
jgi:hypothetical protein